MFEFLGFHHLLPDLPHLLTFALASFALNITPGADMTFVAATSARNGARSGVTAALGVGAGSLVHLAAAVVGLSALIASSQTAFTVLKWAGAAYGSVKNLGRYAASWIAGWANRPSSTAALT